MTESTARVTNPYLEEVDGRLQMSAAGKLHQAIVRAATEDARSRAWGDPSNLYVYAFKGNVVTIRADAPEGLWPRDPILQEIRRDAERRIEAEMPQDPTGVDCAERYEGISE